MTPFAFKNYFMGFELIEANIDVYYSLLKVRKFSR